MSCYMLPQNIIDDMTSSIRRYWWSRNKNKKGWHLLPWDMVCHPKSAGGIGFRDLHLFNIALLGKKIWCLICHPNNLLAQVYKAKYYPSGDILDSQSSCRASFAWKGLSQALSKL
ncbi:hypothetical protein GQ457_12G014410 [Hibiscus cannabinus]